VLELAAAGVAPGGLARNRVHFAPRIAVADGFDVAMLDALYDPQTSGGLFVCVPERKAAAFERGLARRRVPCLDAGRAKRRGAHAVVIAAA
jgi:selenide,water dikinase